MSGVELWMPVWLKDRRAAVATLTKAEHSAFDYLEMLFWERSGVIPDNDRDIARELRISVKQWQTFRGVLLKQCTVSGGLITHPRIVAEVSKAKVNLSQKSKAGKASAAARAAASEAQRNTNGCSTAVATAVQPRAGGGVGVGIIEHQIQEEGLGGSLTHAREAGPFAVIAGGAQ